MKELILEMNNITKTFPGVKALDNVNLKVKKGTIHSLMGENGAGKSTLMKCLFGIYIEDGGHIEIDGKQVHFDNPKQALENGVAMVHQELNQATSRSVMDNMWLGRYPKKGIVVDEKKMYKDTLEIFKSLNINVDPLETLSELSVSQRQMVEIAKAVSYDSKIIVFDEPTSSLTEKEVGHLFEIIFQLKEQGCAIIYISHKMEEILTISDEVTILRDGTWISTTSASELTTDIIINQMVGRELKQRFPDKTNKPSEILLEVKNLSGLYPDSVNDATFDLRKGEILGVAGLVGAGRSELLELLYGMRTYGSGEVHLHGKSILNKSPIQAIDNGFALLTEERRATGIFGVLSVKDNAVIANLKEYKKHGILSDKLSDADAKWVINATHVKTPSPETRIMSLSGGNQQKVILGRWLLTSPEILMLDEPTRGIDVGAKYEIYQLMLELAEKDKSIIMVSSEMPELLGICDRILVMSNHRVAGVVDAKSTNQEELMALSAKYL